MSSSGALFPSNISTSRGGSSSKSLVEFRAGKMSLRGGTVSPDQRRGLVYVQQSDDSLIQVCWKDRSSGLVEEVRATPNGSSRSAEPPEWGTAIIWRTSRPQRSSRAWNGFFFFPNRLR